MPICKGLPLVRSGIEVPFKATGTGIVKLKERSFRKSYWLSPGYCQNADGTIITKREAAEQEKNRNSDRDKKKFSPGQRSKQANERADNRVNENFEDLQLNIAAAERKPRQYLLKKRIIRARIAAMSNMLCYKFGHKARLHFFTITFKAGTSDAIAYRLLNTWLTNLRQKGLLKSYLWVAERQQNKTIHFHLLVPHYMKVQQANACMRESIIFLIKKGVITDWNLYSAKKYNGIDIAKDRKTKRVVNFAERKKERALSRYITKYITKNDTTSDRLPWHNSRDWSALALGVCLSAKQLIQLIPDGNMLQKKSFENEYVQFWPWAAGPPGSLMKHLAEINYFMVRHGLGWPPGEIFFN
jgi:hypothetical protein